MTLNEYITNLQKFVAEDPSRGELLAIYSSDDEGNDFNEVYWDTFAIGHYSDREFMSEDCIKNEDLEDDNDFPINAVVIN